MQSQPDIAATMAKVAVRPLLNGQRVRLAAVARGARSSLAAFGARVVHPLRDPRGFNLIEVAIAVGILGFVGVGIMAGLGVAFRAQDINRVGVVGENLARAVLEDIRFQPYEDDYSPFSVPVPSGYSFTVTTVPFCAPKPCVEDIYLQKNTVIVSRGTQGVLSVEDLKVRRDP